MWLLGDGLGNEPSQLTVSTHLLSDLSLWPYKTTPNKSWIFGDI